MRALILALALAATSLPARAVDDYTTCLTLIELDKKNALTEAGEWARFGKGGVLARHCYALAMLANGAPLSAADELMAAAMQEPGLSDLERSNLFVQAGEILLDAGEDLSPAIAAEQAVKLAPKNPAAVGLRAAVKLQTGNHQAALADLDNAIALGGPNAELLTLRASARRLMGQGTAARDDALWATELDPNSARAWMERGRAEAMVKDRHGARQSFFKVMDLAKGTDLARAAQLALQRMDTGADGS